MTKQPQLNMKRFENINGETPVIEVKEHHYPGTKQFIVTFKNGYSASVIPEYKYDGDGLATPIKGLYELAVFKNGELCYDTPVTNDVLRRLNDPQLQDAVEKVKRL